MRLTIDPRLLASALGVALASSGVALGATQVRAGAEHTCALVQGKLRCWGLSDVGQLGYASTENIGDDEPPRAAGDVTVGGTVSAFALGFDHTCAVLSTGALRCWGANFEGQLGYANGGNSVGDDETPAAAGSVPLGVSVTRVAAGDGFTCAVTSGSTLRCFGLNAFGELGYGSTENVTAAAAADVNVGAPVAQIAAGYTHACALTTSGAVRCWGDNTFGQLGYGHANSIGDDETPASAGNVNVGGTVTQLAAGQAHTCALLTSGAVRCWGDAELGQLGYGNRQTIGDTETPASAGSVAIGGTATQIAVGAWHSCALLSTGRVRCWGDGTFGKLGLGNERMIGDDELPQSVAEIDVGGSVTQISAGVDHTCALLTTGAVRCWGDGFYGQLGYGNTNGVGDVQAPALAGDVPVDTLRAVPLPRSAGPACALGLLALALARLRRVRPRAAAAVSR